MGKLGDRIDSVLAGGGKAVILGLGVSNEPLARMLAASGLGGRLTVRDRKTSAELGGKAFDLLMAGARLETGRDPVQGICTGDDMSDTVIFRSPGIRPDAGELPEAVGRGALLTSEMEWFCDISPARILAVTGSDGKTTTSTLTSLILGAADLPGRTFLGGNIGTPLLDVAGEMTSGDTAVLELSSFQLQTMSGPADRACITNITPNHLNWHRDMDEYIGAKYRVLGPRTQLAVLNAKDPLSSAAAGAGGFRGRTVFFTARNGEDDTFAGLTHGVPGAMLIWLRDGWAVLSDGVTDEPVFKASEIAIPGLHNVENYMAAAALTLGMAGFDAVRKVAATFRGVPHRFELVRVIDGVRYYNSSIDSTPTRTVAALSNLDCGPVVILGGRDKGVPFDGLAAELFRRASAAVLTGEAAPMIEEAIYREAAKRGGFGDFRVVRAEGFAEAVAAARALSRPGGAVLLSPACTSFDRFANFEERGREFRRIVNELAGNGRTEKDE